MEEFFDTIVNLQVDLKEQSQIINEISDVSKRSIDDSSNSEHEQLQDKLAQLRDNIHRLSAQMKKAIQSFEVTAPAVWQPGRESLGLHGPAGCTQKEICGDHPKVRHAKVKQASRRSMKARINRQIRIVKPDAAPNKFWGAVKDQVNGRSGAVFQQAVCSLFSPL
jgi:t-SNARE complex subunit (syntaxin)